MLKVELGFSRTLAALLGTVHLCSFALIWGMPIAVALQAGLSAAIVMSWLVAWRRDCTRSRPDSIVRLSVGSGGACRCQSRDGAWFDAAIAGSSMVTPWLSVLNVKPETTRRSRHVVLLPDMLDPDAYRRLRVLLRWAGPSLAPRR